MAISSDASAILSIGDDTTLTCWNWKYVVHYTTTYNRPTCIELVISFLSDTCIKNCSYCLALCCQASSASLRHHVMKLKVRSMNIYKL